MNLATKLFQQMLAYRSLISFLVYRLLLLVDSYMNDKLSIYYIYLHTKWRVNRMVDIEYIFIYTQIYIYTYSYILQTIYKYCINVLL